MAIDRILKLCTQVRAAAVGRPHGKSKLVILYIDALQNSNSSLFDSNLQYHFEFKFKFDALHLIQLWN